ncbi:Tetratricopeptide repeat protein [Bremerella volcania]|uniref:Tetratricopeptide repeat protein n=1 Tax=Bremerella volcania TaxID=2527984 RepID=A0A518C4I0_9BACT|nr:hypothetical protein [Bremerella volcania]QDU74132.1 Tetratricopeptide repeat protein [Bremerella volcania]
MRSRWTWFVLLALAFPCAAYACLWDEDTLEMERQQYPEVHELIAGHFVRHSDAYYQWRIGDRTTKSVDQRTPEDYNDIAVAYDKLGEHDKAIETIREKMQRWPDENLYESQANLGTFLIHSGKFEDGLVHIQKAIEINPDAHFGREIYQQLLVQYVIERRAAGAKLPLNPDKGEADWDEHKPRVGGFAAYVKKHRGDDAKDGVDAEYARALKGVLGMVRFGHHDSPILMEAVGDLLSATEPANQLAARAYLRASYEADSDVARADYRLKAKNAVASQELPIRGEKIEIVEAALKDELAQANAFAAQIAADEASWIARGDRVDEKFNEKYYDSPKLNVAHAQDEASLAMAEFNPTGPIILPSGSQQQTNTYRSSSSRSPQGFSPQKVATLIFFGVMVLAGAVVYATMMLRLPQDPSKK